MNSSVVGRRHALMESFEVIGTMITKQKAKTRDAKDTDTTKAVQSLSHIK
jgi:hypothetical protein